MPSVLKVTMDQSSQTFWQQTNNKKTRSADRSAANPPREKPPVNAAECKSVVVRRIDGAPIDEGGVKVNVPRRGHNLPKAPAGCLQ